MATAANDRVMASERIAPGMLPRVLGSFDMVVIFVAIVLFIVNASAVQPAGPAAFSYWILGFLLFLIPGALITAQLGQMFPQEGSLYAISQFIHRRQLPAEAGPEPAGTEPTPSPAG